MIEHPGDELVHVSAASKRANSICCTTPLGGPSANQLYLDAGIEVGPVAVGREGDG